MKTLPRASLFIVDLFENSSVIELGMIIKMKGGNVRIMVVALIFVQNWG